VDVREAAAVVDPQLPIVPRAVFTVVENLIGDSAGRGPKRASIESTDTVRSL